MNMLAHNISYQGNTSVQGVKAQQGLSQPSVRGTEVRVVLLRGTYTRTSTE